MKNHSKIFKFLLSILLISCISSLDANAQNKKISLQGFLKDANGKAVADGIQVLTFKIYTVASGGPVLWSEDQSIPVVGGVYAVQLGKVVDMSILTWKVPHFLGVTVQGVELIPRTELTYSPYSLSTQTVVCSGALGDVKYSILNPTQFASVNGDCWVPMDGRSMAGSALATLIGRSNVPNGGGLFLRGQENDNTDFDAGRDKNSAIGTLQEQATQTHQHSFNGTTSSNDATPYNNVKIHSSMHAGNGPTSDTETQALEESQGAPDYYIRYSYFDLRGNHNHSFSGTTADNNGSSAAETRPKNLNFWTYIRVN